MKEEKPWYGTRPFTPPEVFVGHAEDVGTASDCWAAGVFLAGMMFNTEKTIFPDGGKNSIMMLLTQAEVRDGNARRLEITYEKKTCAAEIGLPLASFVNICLLL